jgi:hypothetical protein
VQVVSLGVAITVTTYGLSNQRKLAVVPRNKSVHGVLT